MNIFNVIKEKLAIIEVVNDYTKLKRAGLYWKGLCPFHHEKTPSFTVSPSRNIFYCFGCHSGGDVITFIAKAQHCSPFQAAQHLIERFGLDVPAHLQSSYTPEQADAKQRYFQLCATVAAWAHEQLNSFAAAKEYVLKRNITAESVNRFLIGYFPGGPKGCKSLMAYCNARNFLTQELLDVGILVASKNALYSPFEERILFPISDQLGHFCGFGGRIFKPTDERAKYYNSKENSFFNKSALLFGFMQAKNYIRDQDAAFLVEGYTDCIAMAQHGFSNTVATLGTACTSEHLHILARHTSTIYVLYDGDNAGQQAMLRLARLCWDVALDMYIVPLPQGEDPASFLHKRGVLNDCIAQAKDIFSFFIDTLGSDFNQKKLQEKLDVAKQLISLINQLSDPIKQNILLQQASTRLGIPLASLLNQIPSYQQPDSSDKKPAQNPIENASLLEKKIAAVILGNIELLKDASIVYLLDYFSEPLQRILKGLAQAQNAGPTLTSEQLVAQLPEGDQQITLYLMVLNHEQDSINSVEYLLAQFHKKHWKSIVQDIKLKLAIAKQQQNQLATQEIIDMFEQLKKKLLERGWL